MKLKSIEEVEKEAHIKGLTKTRQAKEIDGEMTALSYGYHSSLVGEAVKEDRQHLIQTIRKEVEGQREVWTPDEKAFIENGTTEELKNDFNRALNYVLEILTTLEEEVSK